MALDFDGAVRVLLGARRVLISSHVSLDGDAVGSELAVALCLRASGREAVILNESPCPAAFRFLPGAELLPPPARSLSGPPDLWVILDAPTIDRLGNLGNRAPRGVSTLCVDHHISDGGCATVNLTDERAAATGMLLFELLRRIAGQGGFLAPGPEVAANLYTAILTDTGRFTHTNTRPEVFEACAELIRIGANPTEIARQIYGSVPLSNLKLRALATQTLKYAAEGRIGTMRVTKEMFQATGLTPLDIQEFVEIPRSLEGTAGAVLFTEVEPGIVKVSLRSNGAFDANAVGRKFNGGGHAKAAGAQVSGTLESVEPKILAALEEALDGRDPKKGT